MNEQEKNEYNRVYKAAKQQGELFYPNAIIKDAVVALFIFLALVALSAFFKAELQAPANPSDSTYIPHPEWYFLFLYEMLKFFPGDLVIFGVIILPAIVFATLFTLPWLDHSKERHPRKRPIIMGLMTFAWVIIIGFTLLAFVVAPHQVETVQSVAGFNQQQANAGQALFIDQCSSCHGKYGEGGPNPATIGSVIPPISSKGFLSTFTDDTLFNIITNGLSDRGMAAFSQGKGGPLDDSKIEELVSYIRHWETDPPVVAEYIPPTPSTSASSGADLNSSPPSADQGVAARGPALFASWCANCHGSDGMKAVGPNQIIIVAPAFLVTKQDTELVDTIYNGFPKPNKMPAFRTVFSSQDISDLLAWLRTYQHK